MFRSPDSSLCRFASSLSLHSEYSDWDVDDLREELSLSSDFRILMTAKETSEMERYCLPDGKKRERERERARERKGTLDVFTHNLMPIISDILWTHSGKFLRLSEV